MSRWRTGHRRPASRRREKACIHVPPPRRGRRRGRGVGVVARVAASTTRVRESRYIPSAMIPRAKLGRAAAVLALVGPSSPSAAGAQENPVRRAANIVSVAVEEYAKGVDEK